MLMPVRLPPGRFKLATRPNLIGFTPGREYDRNRRGRRFGRQRRRCAGRGDDGDLVHLLALALDHKPAAVMLSFGDARPFAAAIKDAGAALISPGTDRRASDGSD
jgi:hypothetical protein